MFQVLGKESDFNQSEGVCMCLGGMFMYVCAVCGYLMIPFVNLNMTTFHHLQKTSGSQVMEDQ